MFKYKSMFWGTQVLPALWSVSIFSIYTILAIVVVRDAPGTDVAIYCGRPDIRLFWKLDAGSPMWPDIKMFYSLINNTCYIFFLVNFSLENWVWLCWWVSGRGSNWRPSALAACNRPFIFIGAWPPRLTFPRRSAIYHSVWAKRPFLLQPSHRSSLPSSWERANSPEVFYNSYWKQLNSNLYFKKVSACLWRVCCIFSRPWYPEIISCVWSDIKKAGLSGRINK